jgi:hypothetical protein
MANDGLSGLVLVLVGGALTVYRGCNEVARLPVARRRFVSEQKRRGAEKIISSICLNALTSFSDLPQRGYSSVGRASRSQ